MNRQLSSNKTVMANMLANSCPFTYPVNTKPTLAFIWSHVSACRMNVNLIFNLLFSSSLVSMTPEKTHLFYSYQILDEELNLSYFLQFMILCLLQNMTLLLLISHNSCFSVFNVWVWHLDIGSGNSHILIYYPICLNFCTPFYPITTVHLS